MISLDVLKFHEINKMPKHYLHGDYRLEIFVLEAKQTNQSQKALLEEAQKDTASKERGKKQ